jgi:hypothetical protein
VAYRQGQINETVRCLAEDDLYQFMPHSAYSIAVAGWGCAGYDKSGWQCCPMRQSEWPSCP